MLGVRVPQGYQPSSNTPGVQRPGENGPGGYPYQANSRAAYPQQRSAADYDGGSIQSNGVTPATSKHATRGLSSADLVVPHIPSQSAVPRATSVPGQMMLTRWHPRCDRVLGASPRVRAGAPAAAV